MFVSHVLIKITVLGKFSVTVIINYPYTLMDSLIMIQSHSYHICILLGLDAFSSGVE